MHWFTTLVKPSKSTKYGRRTASISNSINRRFDIQQQLGSWKHFIEPAQCSTCQVSVQVSEQMRTSLFPSEDKRRRHQCKYHMHIHLPLFFPCWPVEWIGFSCETAGLPVGRNSLIQLASRKGTWKKWLCQWGGDICQGTIQLCPEADRPADACCSQCSIQDDWSLRDVLLRSVLTI